MRGFVSLVCVFAILAVSPLRVAAQAGEAEASRVEKRHPEAQVDPAEPKPEKHPSTPVLKLELDSEGFRMVPSLLLTEDERAAEENARRRGVGIGVGVGVVVVLGIVGIALAASAASINRNF